MRSEGDAIPHEQNADRARILVVEDEQIVALELRDRLARMGHTVIGVVASGEDAIEAARRQRPDLVLMDIKLQGTLDGIEAATAIRADSDAAIVYLTAFADDETLRRAKVTQPYGYILKPFHERELQVVIEVSLYRRSAEGALRCSELWRKALLRSIGDAVIAADSHGVVKFMNPLAESLTGWSEAEAIGHALAEVFRVARPVERRSGPWTDATVTNLIRKDGAHVAIDVESTPIRDAVASHGPAGTVCVFRDASERRRLRDRQRLLAHASSELATSLDREAVLARVTSLIARSWADWCVVHLADKRGAFQLAAIAHRDPQKHAALSELVGARVRRPDATLEEVIRTGLPKLDEQVSRGDWPARVIGVDLPVDVSAASAITVPLRARDHGLGTLTVVSERACPLTTSDVPFAEELGWRLAYGLDNAQLYADARSATAMRDDVLAVVSHDLRNPLSTIGLVAEHLLLAKSPSIEGSVAIISRNVVRMKRLIDDLLDVGRVDTGRLSIEPARVSATDLVEESLAGFEPMAADRAIRLESHVPAADVLCDRGRALQVLSNLIGNALKFSPDRSTIRIAGAVHPGWYELSVSDQGIGLAPDQLDRVFERHWQAPETKHRGSGLGLYIAKGIVEAHGGRIWAEQRPTGGSAFRFTIPLAVRSEMELAAPP